MKLIYRGTSYDYTPGATSGNTGRPTRPHHASSAPYTLIYRGQTLLVDPTQTAEPSLPHNYELIYRGERYQMNGTAPAVTRQAPVSVPSALPRHYIGKVHQANLQENLQRRMKAAKAQGDQHLVALLEAEQKQIMA
jgi:Domain of unknown function (DUF4278)